MIVKLNALKVSILYIYLMLAYIFSFAVFKFLGDDYAIMRLCFFVFVLIFSFFFILRNNLRAHFSVHYVLIACIAIRALCSDIDVPKGFFVLCFVLVPVLMQTLYTPLTYKNSIGKLFGHLYYIQLALSLYYFVFYDYTDRFIGYTDSATTYSVYLICFFSGYLFTSRNKYVFVHLLLTFFLVNLTQTRSTMLVLIVISLVYRFRSLVLKHIKLMTIFLIVALLLLLPVAALFSDGLKIMNRYGEKEEDTSTMSRLYYYNNQIKSLSNFTYVDYIFGNGVDSSKKVNSVTKDSYEIDQHNDFFVLLYDYGAIIAGLFLYVLIVKINSAFSFVFIMIYLTSFYHNMIYDFWLISFFYISSLYSQRKNVTETVNLF